MTGRYTCSRRAVLGGAIAAALSGRALRARAAENRLAFLAAGKEFTFDTGSLCGVLHAGGQSKGLTPVFDSPSRAPLAKSLGLFSHYRLLDETTRYGKAGWDWPSTARVSSAGSVEVCWTADDEHPFDMAAEYRWTAADTLDLTTRVRARKDLRHFEVFLASYFDGFPETSVYARGPSGWVSPKKEDGVWHAFPRDDAALAILRDGRWKRPPHPVEWVIRPRLAAPLAVRRDSARGLAAVLMSRAADCFAVAVPYDGEQHRSVYFSLFGRDLKNGESVAAHSRLVIARDATPQRAAQLYDLFCRERPQA